MMPFLADNGFTAADVLSMAASAVSVGLAVVAIWVTLHLYRMSNDVSAKTKDDVGSVKADVAKLEQFVRSIHAETFKAYREDHAHFWDLLPGAGSPPEQREAREKDTEKKLEEMRAAHEQQFRAELEKLAAEGKAQRAELGAVMAQFRNVLQHAVKETREIEAQPSREVKVSVLRAVLRRGRLSFAQLYPAVNKAMGGFVEPPVLFGAVNELTDEGLLERSSTGELMGQNHVGIPPGKRELADEHLRLLTGGEAD